MSEPIQIKQWEYVEQLAKCDQNCDYISVIGPKSCPTCNPSMHEYLTPGVFYRQNARDLQVVQALAEVSFVQN